MTTNEERLIARVLRDVLAHDVFPTDVDVKEALKVRCARLRIRYDATTINAALDLVATNRTLSRGQRR